jgi:hypothetical protein
MNDCDLLLYREVDKDVTWFFGTTGFDMTQLIFSSKPLQLAYLPIYSMENVTVGELGWYGCLTTLYKFHHARS